MPDHSSSGGSARHPTSRTFPGKRASRSMDVSGGKARAKPARPSLSNGPAIHQPREEPEPPPLLPRPDPGCRGTPRPRPGTSARATSPRRGRAGLRRWTGRPPPALPSSGGRLEFADPEERRDGGGVGVAQAQVRRRPARRRPGAGRGTATGSGDPAARSARGRRRVNAGTGGSLPPEGPRNSADRRRLCHSARATADTATVRAPRSAAPGTPRPRWPRW